MPIVSPVLSADIPSFVLLLGQANKLSTVKKCLNEVLKFGGPFNPRDLYPVSTFHAGVPRCNNNIRVVPAGVIPS